LAALDQIAFAERFVPSSSELSASPLAQWRGAFVPASPLKLAST
jgi:hypothetical protein